MKVKVTLMVMTGMTVAITFLSWRVHTLKLETLALQGEVMHWQGKVPAIAQHRQPFTQAKP